MGQDASQTHHHCYSFFGLERSGDLGSLLPGIRCGSTHEVSLQSTHRALRVRHPTLQLYHVEAWCYHLGLDCPTLLHAEQ